MALLQLTVVWGLAALLVSTSYVEGSLFQNVTFFTEPDCSGTHTTIFGHYDSSDSDSSSSSKASSSIAGRARSARIFGLWWFIVEDESTDVGLFGWTFNGDLDAPCNTGSVFELLGRSKNAEADETSSSLMHLRYIMMYRLGPSALDGPPALTMYSEPNFRGTPTEILLEDEASSEESSTRKPASQSRLLEEEVLVKSLVFTFMGTGDEESDSDTAPEGWTLYSGDSYDGLAYHVTVKEDDTNTGPLRFIANIGGDGILVGSIRFGLHGTNDTGGVTELRTLVAGASQENGAGSLKNLIAELSGSRPPSPRGSDQRITIGFIVAGTFLFTLALVWLVLCIQRKCDQRLNMDNRRGSWKELLISD